MSSNKMPLYQCRIEDFLQSSVAPQVSDSALSLFYRKPVCIELFAGGGGLALGFEQAGIEGAAFIEYNHDACETLRANRPGWNVLENDICEVSFKKYEGKIDVVSGGAPCQSFSYAGKRKGFDDVRGTLFEHFARALNEIKPSMFLFENVCGLLKHNSGATFKTICSSFEQQDYKIQYDILDACRHGVAQKRKRLIIVGIKKNLLNSLKFKYPAPEKKWTVLKDALKNVPESPYIKYSDNKANIMKLVPPGGCWVNLPEEIARKYLGKSWTSGGGKRGVARRISWEEPCLTLTTSPSQKQTERCHPDETRPFTVREYARIQSFPDSWQFSGNVNSQYKQIGNAVPVELARRLGVQVIEALKPLLAIKREKN